VLGYEIAASDIRPNQLASGAAEQTYWSAVPPARMSNSKRHSDAASSRSPGHRREVRQSARPKLDVILASAKVEESRASIVEARSALY
jgi:hypothetical protein